jgi:tetratricopeptide (TPR) repeat protein
MIYNECPHNNRYRTLLGSVKALMLRAFRSARSNERAPAPFPRDGNVVTRADAALDVSALIDAGNWAEAERRIAHLICADPNDPGLQFMLGRLALKKGENRAAAEYFENAAALRPDQAAAHIELAKLYSSWREPGRAQACYETALKLVPEVAGLHNNLGLLHLNQERLSEAEHCFESALRLKPDFAVAKNNLGRVYSERKQYDAAIDCYRAALAMDPGNIHADINIGLALNEIGEHDKALAQLEMCHRAAPGHIEIMCGLGMASFVLGRTPQAQQYYREVLALDADCADANFGLANIALHQGDLAAGWKDYEWRARLPRFARYYRSTDSRWGGERLSGKTLLVDAEQGYGDTLLFARFLPRISQSGATVVFRCRQSLHRLLQHSSRAYRVIDDEVAETVSADAAIPLLSLGHMLGIGLADLPGPIPYLRALPNLAEGWRAKLAGDRKFRVGLAWGANPLRTHQRGRIPPADDYRVLAAVPGVAFYNLQPGFSKDDIAHFPVPLIDLASGIEDFADTAALVDNLDLVISVDTSVAHLSGAMGKPTWVLHPGIPDWRWEIAGKESPWYPTVRLFRRRNRAWTQTLADVSEALHEISRG